MKPVSVVRALAPMLLICSVLYSQDARKQAVSYDIQKHESSSVRQFSGDHNFYTVDINSRIGFKVDKEKLLTALPEYAPNLFAGDAELQKFQETITHLNNTAQSLSITMESMQVMFQAFNAVESKPEDAGAQKAFRDASGQFSRNMLAVIDSLEKAIEARLKRQGLADAQIETILDQKFDIILAGKGGAQYNWDAFAQSFQLEINALNTSVADKVGKSNVTLAVQGTFAGASQNLLKKTDCTPVIFQKMQYTVSPEEQALYQRFQDLAGHLDSAQGVGEAVRSALKAQLEMLYDDLKALLAVVAANIDEVGDKLEALADWVDAERLKAWINSWEDQIRAMNDPEAEALVQAWEAVDQAMKDTEQDYETLKALKNLDDTLRTQTPETALTTITTTIQGLVERKQTEKGFRSLNPKTWEARYQTIKTFIDQVDNFTKSDAMVALLKSDNGPWPDIQAALGAIKKTKESVVSTSAQIIAFFKSVAGDFVGSSNAAISITSPDPSTAVPIADGGEIEGLYDLRCLSDRKPGDIVAISYHVFKAEDGSKLTSWDNEFTFVEYGYRSRVLAGLAFVQQDEGDSDTWKPTATLTWVVSYKRWARKDQPATRVPKFEPFSGLGISSMALDFDPEEDAELGLAASASFLSNRLIVGIGTNLQAEENKGFIFFSLRLFKSSSLFNGLAPAPSSGQ